MIRPGKIPIDPQAFSSLRPRRPRKVNGGHLKFIRSLPCVICLSRNNVQAAHIRMASIVHGKRNTGVGEKSSDRFVTCLCPQHHEEQHRGNEAEFWKRYGIDQFHIALSLFAHSGDEEAAELVIRMARVRT